MKLDGIITNIGTREEPILVRLCDIKDWLPKAKQTEEENASSAD